MLLDVLTLLGALYVLLTIVEYLCSLWKPTITHQPSQIQQPIVPEKSQDNKSKEICDNCGNSRPQAKSKIKYIIMANELGTTIVHEPTNADHDLDQYQNELLKRKKRIAAGEVKGFYLGTSNNHDNEGPMIEIDRRHSSYSGDYNMENEPIRRKSLVKDSKSLEDANMVGLSERDENCPDVKRQQFQQRSSLDERRLSLDTVPVKLSAPVTVIKPAGSAGSSGSPFKISENSAFTPIQPRRDASVERRAPLLSVGSGSMHAQSVPDISIDSGVHTASSSAMSAAPQGPIQITVVMRPTSGNTQQQAQQKVSSTLVWTSSNQNKDENFSKSTADIPTDIKSAQPSSSAVRLKMVQTVTNSYPDVQDPKIPLDQKLAVSEPESPVKLIQADQEKSRKAYVKSSTTGLASTAALARATATANFKNNYYSNSLTQKDLDTVAPHRRQHTPPPPPPPPSAELLTPQLLKKQFISADTYPRQNQRQFYIDQPQMALTKAMRPALIGQQPSVRSYFMNETSVPQPYHPPTMANYEQLPPSPRISVNESRFSFNAPDARQPRQQQRAKYSPRDHPGHSDEVNQNVIWKPADQSKGATVDALGPHGHGQQHSLSVDEGMGHERSRSRERSRIRRQHPPSGHSVDEIAQYQPPPSSKSSSIDFYRTSFDEDRNVPREITDQGVPITEDVLKGGNVSSKTKLFEALAEQELQELDSLNHFPQQPRKLTAQNNDRWIPGSGASSASGSVQSFLTPKPHKKMERSHTVHTVRSLMAPDAYQYENAPHKYPYSSLYDQEEPQSPRYTVPVLVPPTFYGPQPTNTTIHVQTKEPDVIEFPPASISPRSVQKEQAVITGKAHQFQQAQFVQPNWNPQAQIMLPQAPLQAPLQAPVMPVPYQSIPAPMVSRVTNISTESGDVFEDEMSKMSIAEKAKLFEQKAEEQTQQKKRYVIRHKTQPVTSEEVMKARSVINDQLSKPIKQKSDDEVEEQDDEPLKPNPTSSTSRNVIIYKRTPDRRSTSRIVDDSTSDKESDQKSNTPSVKPRRVVYLHASAENGQQSLEQEISDQNNNNDRMEKSNDTPKTKQPDENAHTNTTLTNGHHKPAPAPGNGEHQKSISPDTIDQVIREKRSRSTSVAHAKNETPYTRPIGVREKAKKLMDDINSKQTKTATLTNGQNGHHQYSTRILVNHDEENSNIRPIENGHATLEDSMEKFCSTAKDLENGEDEKVEDDSFMSIVRAPMIRLQHFERPKPNRRHSTCGSRRFSADHK